jgi:hypothetical protein
MPDCDIGTDMSPSFLTLFKRGKYHRLIAHSGEEASRGDEGERSEAERFSVAALAFCLNHAPAFRECFFHSVMSPDILDYSDMRIEVEPSNWADLLIQTTNEVYVIECKIDAAIVRHQNPWASDSTFWRSDVNPTGYGYEFADEFPKQKRHFRLLHQDSTAKLVGSTLENEMTLRAVNWTALNNAWIKREPTVASTQKALISDLFDSLGQLGIRTFGHRVTNIMKAESPEHAAQCGKILTDAAGKIDLDSEARFLVAKFEDPAPWEFGVDVRAKKKGNGSLPPNHQNLIKIIEPSTEYLGWFGYEFNKEHPDHSLSVYLYCGNAQAADRVEKKLSDLPSDRYSVTPVDDGEGWKNVVVRGASPSSESHRDWFVQVFEKLGISPV